MEQRRRQAAESLRSHSLFGFQVHDAFVAERLRELQELLLATCGERDQVALLSENVRELEEQLGGRSEHFLLQPLRHFEQEMELLLDVASGEEVEEQDDELSDEEQECLSLSQDPLFIDSPVLSPNATKAREAEDEVLCGVCCAPDSLENDPIVICELCGVAVHQTCYRLAVVPDGDWYCHPCRQYLDAREIEKNVIPTHELECQACCTKAGAFAPTVDGGWVHVACSMFLPELYLQEKHTARFQGPLDGLQVVCGLDKLKARRRLRCCFCKKSNEKGACAQCAVGKCVVAYHALCALRNGIKIRYMQDKGQFGSGCLKHQAEFLKLGTDSEIDAAVVEKKDTSTAETNGKPKPRRIRKNSWSDEEGSESDDDSDDENDLDSDSEHDGSQDSLSDDDLKDEKAEFQSKPSPTKMSPPRLLGGPPIKKSGGKQGSRPRRNRQIKLSFTSAEETTASSSRSQNPARDGVASAASNVMHTTPSPAQEAVTIAPEATKNGRLLLDTNVFAPVCFPTGYKVDDASEQEFEYVMVLITTRPLGLGIGSSTNAPGMFLLAKTTTNAAITAAIKQGVIKNSDEVFALNDRILRTLDMKSFKELVPSLPLPIRCWIRTKRKSKVFSSTSSEAASGVESPVKTVSVKVSSPAVPEKKGTVLPFKSPTMYQTPSETNNSQTVRVKESSRENDGGVISLGMDWPWVFLRSDGKLAMNLFWKSLDSAFFLRKINKRTFSQLQEKVEEMCGVRLSRSHAEYEQVRELLAMPRRERVPSYLVEFRNTLKEKQKFLSSDVLMGVSSESKDTEADVDEQTALEVGTTVSVAKRTWPGMNKLGGVGRIKKVNEEKLPDGRKRFTYNVTFVIGGFDKNVERKYISVVDLESEESNTNEESTSTTSSRRQKSEPEPDVKDTKGSDTATVSLRLAFSLNRTQDEEKLAELQDASIESPPKRRRFQVQFSTENAAVYCERKHDATSSAEHPAKELLLHKHFEVKRAEVDALTNACFSSELLSIEDRVGDEVDDDDTDSEGERDEIKSELATLQEQFRTVMESNELAFASLTKKVDEEYASKEYRQQELQHIQWRNYERMYQELQTAQRQFDESDEDSDAEEDGRVPGSAAKAGSEEEAESEVEDISFGGMFVNKLKQEGSEVCALCELSGGDFTSTDTGRVVHPQCAMFTPETFFKDGVVHGIALVDPERKRLKCTICGGRKGLSKIQCAHRKCVRAYHVACAFVNGLLTRDPYYQAWCPRHLKTSGMGQFVDLPDHLSKKSSDETATATVTATPSTNAASSPARRNRKSSKQRSRQKKSRARQDSTPAEATTAARTDISSSKTNRKRRRKGSNASASGGKSARGTRGSSPRSAIVVEEEPRCARRLEIDEVSDDDDQEAKAVEAWQHGRDPHHVFLKNDVVEVLARDWRGSNKQGGVARVRAVEVVPNEQGGKDVFYDIIHIVGAFKEKRLPAKFVRSYQSNAE